MVSLNKLFHIQLWFLWTDIFQTKILLFLVKNSFRIWKRLHLNSALEFLNSQKYVTLSSCLWIFPAVSAWVEAFHVNGLCIIVFKFKSTAKIGNKWKKRLVCMIFSFYIWNRYLKTFFLTIYFFPVFTKTWSHLD